MKYFCKWTEEQEVNAKLNGVSFDDGRADYEIFNSMCHYKYFAVEDNIASGTNIQVSSMGEEKTFSKTGPIDVIPVLTLLDIHIGGMFYYADTIWVRTDRYSAYSVKTGSCYFGNAEETEEFSDFTSKAKKIAMDKLKVLLIDMDNLDFVLEKD